MFKTISAVILGLFLSVAPCFASQGVDASVDAYVLPSSLTFRILDKPQNLKKSIRMAIEIESLVGELKDLSIFFNSSKDIRVMSEKHSIKSLKQGEKHIVNILAAPTKAKVENGLGSWLRMGVKYVPDYDEILKVVSDAEKYPHPVMRQKLIDDIKEAKNTNEPFIDAVRHFIK